MKGQAVHILYLATFATADIVVYAAVVSVVVDAVSTDVWLLAVAVATDAVESVVATGIAVAVFAK